MILRQRQYSQTHIVFRAKWNIDRRSDFRSHRFPNRLLFFFPLGVFLDPITWHCTWRGTSEEDEEEEVAKWRGGGRDREEGRGRESEGLWEGAEYHSSCSLIPLERGPREGPIEGHNRSISFGRARSDSLLTIRTESEVYRSEKVVRQLMSL